MRDTMTHDAEQEIREVVGQHLDDVSNVDMSGFLQNLTYENTRRRVPNRGEME